MQPQYPQQYAPPAPQPYPAQQPPAPAYAPPMPQYPAQAYPGQPYPQQYAPPAPQQPAAPPPPPGTLDSFYQQPSTGGGPSFKFRDNLGQPMVGKYYEGVVARPVTDADVQAQTDQQGNVRTFRDGRPKFVMVVPMRVQPSQEFPEGVAGWYVKGQARDELARAMAEAGAPVGPPENGAWIRVTLTGVRPVPNMNPAYQYRVEYVRPGDAAPAAPVAPSAPVAQPVQQAPPAQYATPYAAANPGHGPYGDGPGPQYAPVVSTATGAPVVHQQPVLPAPVAAPVAPQPAPVGQPLSPVQVAQAAAPAAADPRLANLSPEQQALFASLTGGTAAPVPGVS